MAARTCTCERCPKCHHRNRENRRRRRMAYGLPGPMTDAEPVRAHLRSLMASGVGQNSIIKASGVPRSTVRALLYGIGSGRPPSVKVRRETADALLGVSLGDGVRRPVIGVRRRIQALLALGWTTYALAERLDVSQARIWEWSTGRGEYVIDTTHNAVAALYDELSMKPGPSNIARTRAGRNGYAPPLAWDDDTIDDPNAEPNFGEKSKGSAPRLPDLDRLVAEVNRSGIAVVAEKYGVGRTAVHKKLRRAGYKASHSYDTKQIPVYMQEAA